MYDPQLYRHKEAIKYWEERGPLITLTRRLKAEGLMTEDDFQRVQNESNAEVDAAVAFAEQAPWEDVADLQRFVYAERAT
jgi:pyruvate dehydrogenase E1 component alpha subunit